MTESTLKPHDDEVEYGLDDVDRGVLFALQRDARNVTAQDIAEEVNVSASTVPNRIANLERAGVIEGYQPIINYEKADFRSALSSLRQRMQRHESGCPARS